MKMKINLIPLEGITWENKEIHLSDLREQVIMALGQPEDRSEESFFYFDNDLRIDFDSDEKVEFIEFLGGMDGGISPMIYGVDAFERKADELYHLLKEKNAGAIDDSENGYAYAFLNSQVGVWREFTPEDVEELIRDSKADGEELSEEELENEKKLADYWQTIGIGREGYYE